VPLPLLLPLPLPLPLALPRALPLAPPLLLPLPLELPLALPPLRGRCLTYLAVVISCWILLAGAPTMVRIEGPTCGK